MIVSAPGAALADAIASYQRAIAVRPDFAEAGGKQPEKIDEMLAASETVVAKLLGATRT